MTSFSLSDLPEDLITFLLCFLSYFSFNNEIMAFHLVNKKTKYETESYIKNELIKLGVIDLASSGSITRLSLIRTPQILIVGGLEDNRRCDSFNPITMSFVKCCSLSLKRSDQFDVVIRREGAVAVSGDDIASVGAIEKYDISTNTWTELPFCLLPQPVVALSSVFNPKSGWVFALGGFNKQSSRRVDSIYSLSDGGGISAKPTDNHLPSSPSWSQCGRLLTARSHHGSALFRNEIWTAGGFTGLSMYANNSVEIYNPEDNVSRSGPSMLCARHLPRLHVIRDVLYAVGGDMTENAHANLTTIERFRPDVSQWEHVTVIPIRRTRCASCVYGDRVFVFGGSDGAQSLRSWDFFDLTTGEWASKHSTLAGEETRGNMVTRRSGTRGAVAVLVGGM